VKIDHSYLFVCKNIGQNKQLIFKIHIHNQLKVIRY